MAKAAQRVASFGTTIFTEINQLSQQYQAINLGQGRPDFDGQPAIIQKAAEALHQGATYNQYPPGVGALVLREAIAAHTAAFYNLPIDPQAGVVVTAGATEGVFSSILGLVDPGDEVIVIEPYFDSYVPGILMAGATPRYVPLHAPSWTFDPDELRAAFNPRTRAILFNTPQNPSGRVFTLAEMTLIAELCQQYDVTIISDEVYEHLVFGEAKHTPIAALPEMFERTVTVSSLGKSYSLTGWKLGWVYGPPHLIAGVMGAHQFNTFCSHHPSQVAAAAALTQPATYYEELQALYTAKRDILVNGLNSAGLKASTPEGTYFVMADFSDVFDGDDVAFAHWLVKEIGVGCIPPSPFYSAEHRHLASKQARFAFCKGDDTLRAASERLATIKRR